jgi:hypothetical protein
MKTKRPPPRAILDLPLPPTWALRRIRVLAAKSENIIFTTHALEQMEAREIFDGDVLSIYRSEASSIKGEVKKGKGTGEYHCKVVRRIRGNREAGVVTIILPADKLLVLTVEWEDLS